MSLVVGLIDGGYAWCPSCGECVDVSEDDFNQILDGGSKEYYVTCPNCGQSFYVSEDYLKEVSI